MIEDVIALPISILMRKSLDEREVPDDWKTANMSPVYKSGGRTTVNNIAIMFNILLLRRIPNCS